MTWIEDRTDGTSVIHSGTDPAVKQALYGPPPEPLCEHHRRTDCQVCPARELCDDFTSTEQDFEFDFIEREKL